MKNYRLKLALTAAVCVFIWTACQKEMVTDGARVSETSPGISFRGDDKESVEALSAQTQSDIINFKGQLNAWKNGQNLTQTISVSDAVLNLESVWNYYVAEVTNSYAEDFHYDEAFEVTAAGTVWTGRDVASVSNEIQNRIAGFFNSISGTDKGIRVVDLEVQTVSGRTTVYVYVNAGKTKIETPNEISTLEAKWAAPRHPVRAKRTRLSESRQTPSWVTT